MGCLLSVSVMGLMATSSKRAYATCCMTQVCCSQSRCPCSWPLLTCSSAGDTQRQVRSVSVGPLGPGAHKVLFEPPKCLWQALGLILNVILHLLPSYWGISFALGHGVSFWWDLTFSCQWLFRSELQFWSSYRRRLVHVLLLLHLLNPRVQTQGDLVSPS